MSKPNSNEAPRTSADVARDLTAKREALDRLATTATEEQAHYDKAERHLAEVGVRADAGDADARADVPTLEAALDTALRTWRTGMLKREILTTQTADLERELAAVAHAEQMAVVVAKVELQRTLGRELKALFATQLFPLMRRYVAAAEAASGSGSRAVWDQIADGLGAALLANVPELWRSTKVRSLVTDVHRPLDFEFWANHNAVRAANDLGAPPADAPIADDDAVVEQAG